MAQKYHHAIMPHLELAFHEHTHKALSLTLWSLFGIDRGFFTHGRKNDHVYSNVSEI